MFDRPRLETHAGRSVSIRRLATDEDGALARVAARDSQSLPAGPWLVAAVDGRALAVLSLSTGSFVADPFCHTVALRNLLEVRAAQLDVASTRRRRRISGRGLRALRA